MLAGNGGRRFFESSGFTQTISALALQARAGRHVESGRQKNRRGTFSSGKGQWTLSRPRQGVFDESVAAAPGVSFGVEEGRGRGRQVDREVGQGRRHLEVEPERSESGEEFDRSSSHAGQTDVLRGGFAGQVSVAGGDAPVGKSESGQNRLSRASLG